MDTKTNQINLLIITLHADPAMPPGVGEWGGTHTYMRELLTELYDKNYNIILITRKVYDSEEDIEVISPNCKIVRLTLGNFGEFDKRLLFNLHKTTLALTMEKLQRFNFKPDIIHSVYWNSGHLAMTIADELKIPYVHSVISNGIGRDAHGATGTAPNRIETEKKVFSNASFIICVAQSEKEEICKFYDISPSKVVVAGQYVHPSFIYAAHDAYGFPRKSGIHYKIEPVYFPNMSYHNSEMCDWWSYKAFTYTGRMSLNKGIKYIIQAWYILYEKYENLCPPLWLVGGNAYDIEQLRPQLGISIEKLCHLEETNKLVWWGYLDENGISALYTRTLALVTHSLYEPGGRVAVEAMCSGIPVLATPNGFALDSIRDWNNGFLIPYGDVNTLAIRLEHFIKQPYLSAIMGEQAKKISNVILRNWDFTGTHLATYKAALTQKKEFTKKSYKYTFDNSLNRKSNIYPYNQLLIDKTDIVDILVNNGIHNITSVQELQIQDSSSLLWLVCTSDKDYYVKIPYDRINLGTLWSSLKEQQYVVSGTKRYKAEIGSLSFNEIPDIVVHDDLRNAIIREKFVAADISLETMLDNAIHKLITFYSKNVIYDNLEIATIINNSIYQEKNYLDIDKSYTELSLRQFSWQNYFMDYSLRVELLRWKKYYMILPNSAQKKVSKLLNVSYDIIYDLADKENALKIVMNHGGCDLKNFVFTPEAILLDNEKLHPGWPGIDFADLIISYVRLLNTNESCELWDSLLNKIPESIIPKDILIGWIVLGTYKEAISDAARINPICPNLYERINILLSLLNRF